MSSLRMWGEFPDFAPCHPGGRNLRIFDRVSGFLRIYVLFNLTGTQSFVLQQLWIGPSQLLSTYLLKMTTDDGFGNNHKQ